MAINIESPDSETVVAAQLDAYYARDIESFMRHWADDCICFDFPDAVLAAGAAAIRARHLIRFQEPDLHARLIQRLSGAGLMVDREIVTRTLPEGRAELDVVATHEVREGLIRRAWFRSGAPRYSVAAAREAWS